MDFDAEIKETLIPFYSRFPIAIVKGKKHWVWDNEGKRYLDFTSGISVVNFGHANSVVNRAVIRQIKRISHISNLFIIPPQMGLACKISQKAFPGKVFFCNSGAEANEAAIKIARLMGNAKKPGKNKLLALEGSFHGRTIAAISLTGQGKYKKGFEPLLANIDFVEADNISSLKKKFDESVCALFLEAVQGEGGIRMLNKKFVKTAAELCRKNDALLVFDEIQAGMGRTGHYFGYQNFEVSPDIITLAKSLGNGFPIGAVLVKPEIADKMAPGMHASTFGGNFLACEAGIAALSLLNEKLILRINEMASCFKSGLERLKEEFPEKLHEIRVYGLMIGLDLDGKCPVKEVVEGLIERKVLALRAGENTLRLLPPFTISRKEIDVFMTALKEVLNSF
jgi:predicted acetylornithine/succinylornithine family transaminase